METKQPEEPITTLCSTCGTEEPCKCKQAAAVVDPWLGRKLNDQYEIISLLARGGMGAVYRARHLHLGMIRAVKVIRQDVEQNENVHARLKQEAQAVAGLSHPNIVSFYDYGISDSNPFVVMDLVEGSSLAEVLNERGKLEIPDAIELFLQVSNGLNHAHSNGVFHRDIKPSNIMLVSESQITTTVKLLDFGIAKIQSNSDEHKLTSTGEIFGSPAYMSPEQGKGQNTDGRSDIYSFGCVMYEVLSGQVPFSGNHPIETIMKQINEKPARLFGKDRAFDPVKQDLEAIVFRCLEKDPAHRYQSMSALRDDLLRLSYGERLIMLHGDLAHRKRVELLSKSYKWLLISFAAAIIPYGVYVSYIDPHTWRQELEFGLQEPDNTSKVLAQLLLETPKDSKSEIRISSILWHQAQYLRNEAKYKIEKTDAAIEKYKEALVQLGDRKKLHLDKMKRIMEANCNDGIAKCYLLKARNPQLQNKQSKREFAIAAARSANAAINQRRYLLDNNDPMREGGVPLALSIGILAEAENLLDEFKHEGDLLQDQERLLRAYAPSSWALADCLQNRACNLIALGQKAEARKYFQEAEDLTQMIYGPESAEAKSLRSKAESSLD
ncbi:MAG: serine/threonine protein kinase [Candidatus Obscuribacterales bacterium]|nr:serine/threonine protein kinase [Candidatus Obscuribacterales bacterium]